MVKTQRTPKVDSKCKNVAHLKKWLDKVKTGLTGKNGSKCKSVLHSEKWHKMVKMRSLLVKMAQKWLKLGAVRKMAKNDKNAVYS